MNEFKKSKGKIIKSKLIKGLIILPFLFIILCVFRLTKIVGVSMEPTLLNGQRAVVMLNVFDSYEPSINDLVLVKKSSYDDKILVKRVVGVPGDLIEIKNNFLYRNGILVDEPYLKEGMVTPDLSVQLSDGEIFILGDNRNRSIDSRIPTIGVIDVEEELIGKVVFDLRTFKFIN